MNAADLLQQVGPWLVGGGAWIPVLKLYLDRRDSARAEAAAKRVARNDLIKIAQEAAGAVIQSLRDDNESLRDELEGVKRDFAEFRETHDAMIRDKDAELSLLRSQVRQAWSFVCSFVRLLDEHGIAHEDPIQPAWMIEAGPYPAERAGGRASERRRAPRD